MNRLFLILLLLAVLALTIVVCLGIGPSGISYKFLSDPFNIQEDTVIFLVRLPRILGSLLAGLGLAAAGCVLQAILRNPLAEPYTLGISGGSALGVTVVLVTPFLAGISMALPLAAFLGAVVSLTLVYLISSRHRFSVSSLILAGVILSFICSSLVLLLFSISRPTEIQSALFFLMGNFSSVNYSLIKIVAAPILISILFLTTFARDIDVLTLGDEKASHLGISATALRRLLFLIASLITGCCVAMCGMVGFVGLMIPHIMRSIVGPRQQVLIITSALGGAIFLIICDTIARSVIAPAELPVGVITGIIGGLFFIGIITNAKNI